MKLIFASLLFSALFLAGPASAQVCFSTACIQARAAAHPAPTAKAVATAPTAAEPASLADDFAAATAEACAPISATNPAPIDDHACTCNQWLTAALPGLKPASGNAIGPISEIERLRIIKIKLQGSTFLHDFRTACGSLFMDIRGDAISAAAFIGTVLK